MAYNSVKEDPSTAGTAVPIATSTVEGKEAQITIIDLSGGAGAGTGSPLVKGQATAANSLPVVQASDDPVTVASGAPADAEAAGNGSIIAILKRLRTLLAGGLPAALGQGTMAQSLTVVVASNQSAVPVNPTTETAGVGVGAAADAEAAANGSAIAILKRLRTLLAAGLPAALVGGRLDANVGAIAGTAASVNSGTRDAGTQRIIAGTGATATRTSSTVTADTQILAANTNRMRATFYNDGDKDFLLAEGTTVTTTDFTVRINPGGSYVTREYNGQIRGMFTAALGSGRLLITEIT